MLAFLARSNGARLIRANTSIVIPRQHLLFSPLLFRSIRLRPILKLAKKFTEDHEWVLIDSDTSIATVSITKHAAANLGDVVFVELPTEGKEITAGDQIGAVESVKAAADIYAPISGTVEEINNQLGEEPSLLNKSPEDEGWLCKIKASNPSEVDALMDEEAYKKFCER